jgi:AcrR family transcriptional regulator
MRSVVDAQSPPPTDMGSGDQYRRLKPGPGRTRAAVVADQHSRIQRALVELVDRDGYGSLTVRKLIALAGVSTATFYSQFDGTDECLISTYRELMRQLSDRVGRSRRRGLSRSSQLTLSLRELVTGLMEDPPASRLILLGVFAVGPAAFGPVRECEAHLEVCLRRCLNRREDRAPKAAVGWVVAGVIQGARSAAAVRTDDERGRTAERLVQWGYLNLSRCSGGGSPMEARPDDRPHPAPQSHRCSAAGPSDDASLTLNAAAKLAAADGYWKLTMSRLSRAAGVPATRIKRQFDSLEVAFLASVSRTAHDLIASLTGAAIEGLPDRRSDPRTEVERLIVWLSVDPPAARLIFSEIVAPGLPGITARDQMISELAAVWRAMLSPRDRPGQFEAEAAVGSLWHSISSATGDDSFGELVAQRHMYAGLFDTSFRSVFESVMRTEIQPEVA